MKNKLLLGLMILLMLVGCGGKLGSYPDSFNFNGRHYIMISELTITDNSKLIEVGRVKDSTRLEKGSYIYEIEGYPDQNVLAVSDKNSITELSVYIEMEGDGSSVQIPVDKTYSDVVEIKIFKGLEQINLIEGDDVQQFLSLFRQRGAENEFTWDRPIQYTVFFLTESVFQYKYPILEKEGIFVFPWTESKLPNEIGEFFVAKQ